MIVCHLANEAIRMLAYYDQRYTHEYRAWDQKAICTQQIVVPDRQGVLPCNWRFLIISVVIHTVVFCFVSTKWYAQILGDWCCRRSKECEPLYQPFGLANAVAWWRCPHWIHNSARHVHKLK